METYHLHDSHGEAKAYMVRKFEFVDIKLLLKIVGGVNF